MSNASLTQIPLELLYLIVSFLDSASQISHLSRASRRLLVVLEPLLYCYDVSTTRGRCPESLKWALLWGSLGVDDRVRIAQKSIQAGCDVDCLVELNGPGYSIFGFGSSNVCSVSRVPCWPYIGAPPPRTITAVGVAAATDCVPLMQTLIDAGADINKPSWPIFTPIRLAVIFKSTDAVKALLGQPTIDLTNKRTTSSLLLSAVMSSALDIASMILPRSNPNESYFYITALSQAIDKADVPMVSLLLTSPVMRVNDFHVHTSSREYPDAAPAGVIGTYFSFACSLASLQIVKLLHANRRVNVDLCQYADYLPVKCAMDHDRAQTVQFLIGSNKCKTARHYVFQRACAENNMQLAQDVLQVAGRRDKTNAKEWEELARDVGWHNLASLVNKRWSKR